MGPRPLPAALAICCVLVLTGAATHAVACTLMRSEDNPKLIVYFTKFAEEDKTEGRFKRCKIVRKARSDTRAFRVTRFRQDATVVVHRSNWP